MQHHYLHGEDLQLRVAIVEDVVCLLMERLKV